MAFNRPVCEGLNYQPCQYGASHLVLRGPIRKPGNGYVAFLGGTETFGKFVEDPFPAILERRLGVTCLNLGSVNAGIGAYLRDPDLMQLARGADAVVIQATDPRNLSNPFYRVHCRRNDRFLGPTPRLKALFPEIDFMQFSFTGHVVTTLRRHDPDAFAEVRSSLRNAWVRTAHKLVRKVGRPAILVWFAGVVAAEIDRNAWMPPRLVTPEMLGRVGADHVATVRLPPGMVASDLSGMIFADVDRCAAQCLPGPVSHHLAADAIEAPLTKLLARVA